MNWIVILWCVMAASSLTLAIIHLSVWLRRRTQHGYLLFFCLASSAAVFGWFELLMMLSQSAEAYASLLKWAHVPLCAMVLSIVGFVHFYLESGRAWLGHLVCATRLAALALNFTTGVNVNYREITSLNFLTIWGGETVASAIGSVNPWTVVPQIANVLLTVFVIDAAATLWRRGGPLARRRAALLGGSLVLCITFAATLSTLILTGAVRAPTMVMPCIFLVVLAMGYELGWDVIAAAQLAADLRASEARFRAVVQAVPNPILLVNEQGAITFANAQTQVVFGYAAEELIGKPVETLVPETARPAHEADRHRYAQHAQARAMGAGRELFGRRMDGTEFPIEVGLNPMRTAEGLFVLASVVDVSERRRIEQVAARQRDEIAHLSRVEMLGALSGSLAHELNQPLTAILANAQAAERFLAQTPPRLDQLGAIIADIVKADRRASTVIQRLRALLKKDKAQHRIVDVNDVVEESLRLMRSDLVSRRVQVVTELERRLPPILADRVQLTQVILNFVMNGCEAMEESQGSLLLMVRTHRSSSDAVEITIADRGRGIPREELDRIFEPFVTTKVQGLGLGLAVCRSIADAHGGRIWATDNPEGGAVLHFEIPIAQRAMLDDRVRVRIRG